MLKRVYVHPRYLLAIPIFRQLTTPDPYQAPRGLYFLAKRCP
jgi:hypothetical protein